MVAKRLRAGRRILTCIVFLVCFLMVSGCGLNDDAVRPTKAKPPSEGAGGHLDRGLWLLGQRDYEGALQECKAALSKSYGKTPGDGALFCLAAVYGDPQNPKKDLYMSTLSLQRVVDEYPRSPWAEPARIFVEGLKEQERLKRAAHESSQESEKLKRSLNETAQENDRLKRRVNEMSQETARLRKIVEDSKTVDVEMDEKKRNQAK
jgi:hypothetical protein